MILKPSIFEGELSIGRSDSEFIDENVQWFINKYEPLFYRATIGEPLYLKFVDGMKAADDGLPVDDIWIDLKQTTEKYAAAFVWFQYMKDLSPSVSGTGTFSIKNESSNPRTPWRKMVRRWNEMVEGLDEMMYWVFNHKVEYPEYGPDESLFCKLDLDEHQNLFGI